MQQKESFMEISQPELFTMIPAKHCAQYTSTKCLSQSLYRSMYCLYRLGWNKWSLTRYTEYTDIWRLVC